MPLTTNAPGYALAYEDRGQGQPVLLIHGYPLSRALWRPQLDGLADCARLIAPDLRGFGDSESTPGPYPMELLAADCAALLDALDVRQPVVVCGLSMGGYVAFAFYRRYPERVAGLILTATRAGADSQEARSNRDKAAILAQESGAPAIARLMLPKMLAPANFETRPELVSQVRDILHSASVTGIVGALQGMRDRPDSTPILAQIACPTLLVFGDEDQFVPFDEIQALNTAIRGARLVWAPEAGHLPNLEQPQAFNQAVRAFLAAF